MKPGSEETKTKTNHLLHMIILLQKKVNNDYALAPDKALGVFNKTAKDMLPQ